MHRHTSAAMKALVRGQRTHRLTQEQMDRVSAAHYRFIARRPNGVRAILRLVDISGLNLSGRELTEADFTGADLKRSGLVSTVLQRAALYCADIQGADLRGSDLRRADLRGSSLRGATLEGANLDEADLRAAVLCHADGDLFHVIGDVDPARPWEERTHNVDFRDCSLKRAKLGGARLKGADFRGANLHGADFRGARLEDATFEGAILTGVRLEQLKAGPAQLRGCLFDPTLEAVGRRGALLERIALAAEWINSGGRRGAAAVLDGEDLRPLGKAFVGARLTASSLRNVCGVSVDFSKAQLQGARFDGADLRDANFREADLRGASFAGANLCHARFDGACIAPLELPNHSERPVDFTGAKLVGVRLPAVDTPPAPIVRAMAALEI